MKFIFLIFILTLGASAGVISPKITVKTSSPVLDFVIRDHTVWAATAEGKALQINAKGKIVSTIVLPKTLNAWNEKTAQKVMSIDLSLDGETVIMAGEDGCLYVSKGGKISKTSFSTKTVIKKIAFVSENRVLLALLSNEVVFFDLQSNKILKVLSGGTSPLSDMALSPDRKVAAIAGEAGIVSLIDTAGGKIIKHLKGGNVDNIYKIDLQNRSIITGGQDRRCIIYTLEGKSYVRFNGTFLIYAVALSPSAARAACALDEENTITLFDIAKRQKIATAIGHNATLNRIAFMDERTFVSCADENKILFWELP